MVTRADPSNPPDNLRFERYHGQPEAIFEGDTFAEGGKQRQAHPVLFRAVSPLLFGWPFVYIEDMEVVWSNGSIHFSRGGQFILNMKSDWEASTVPVRHFRCYP